MIFVFTEKDDMGCMRTHKMHNKCFPCWFLPAVLSEAILSKHTHPLQWPSRRKVNQIKVNSLGLVVMLAAHCAFIVLIHSIRISVQICKETVRIGLLYYMPFYSDQFLGVILTTFRSLYPPTFFRPVVIVNNLLRIINQSIY